MNRSLTRIKWCKPSEVSPNPRNTREHPEEQLDEIAASIAFCGWMRPVIVDEDNMILAGHGARAAAIRHGMKEIPTLVIPGLTESQKRVYLIADNKIAERAQWNDELLAFELRDMESIPEISFDLLGFRDDELRTLFGKIADPGSGKNGEGEGGVRVVVSFDDESEADLFVSEMQDRGLTVRRT